MEVEEEEGRKEGRMDGWMGERERGGDENGVALSLSLSPRTAAILRPITMVEKEARGAERSGMETVTSSRAARGKLGEGKEGRCSGSGEFSYSRLKGRGRVEEDFYSRYLQF